MRISAYASNIRNIISSMTLHVLVAAVSIAETLKYVKHCGRIPMERNEFYYGFTHTESRLGTGE